MRRITVTYSTIGQASPASAGEGRWYRYNGDQPLEATPAQSLAGGEARAERREKRIAEFAAVLAGLGVTDPATAPLEAVIEAGRQVGVREKTAKSYRTALKKQRQEARQS